MCDLLSRKTQVQRHAHAFCQGEGEGVSELLRDVS